MVHLGQVVAYYDYKHSTIRHVKCLITEFDARDVFIARVTGKLYCVAASVDT